VFHARAETGQTAKVNFFVGGNGDGMPYSDSGRKETGYVTLAGDWRRFEIDLAGINLSYISGGFGWVTNYFNNLNKSEIIFYLDDIYYEFAAPRPDPVFLASYEAVPLDQDGYFINSVAYSYDVAMTVLALSYAGRHEQACRVADGLLFALYNDRRFSDVQRGLRNGYGTGSPVSPPGWTSASGKSPFARLAGFFDIASRQWWEDYYSDSYSTGNNAWAIIALLEVWRQSANTDYLKAACTVADYIHTLKDAEKGGFTGGWEGFDDSQKKVTSVSTEHCIDIYAAFSQLARELEENAFVPAGGRGAQFYRDDAAHARAFVMRMYDDAQGLFYTGTKTDGSINRDFYPLDVNTWGLMAFHDDPALDAQRILATIESRFAVGEGLYDFNDDRDGAWFEGSSQAIISQKVTGNTAKYEAHLAIVSAAAEADGSITAASRDGLTTGIYLEGVDSDGKPRGNEWLYNRRIHTGATAWLALAQLGRNPLDPAGRSESGIVRPAATHAKAFVRDGRLYISGLASKTPVRVYTVTGRETASLKSVSATETFICNLPGRGVYIVTAGTGNWKVIY
ncbi:MAG: hypothetical protein LBF85_05295, partial [Tannerella sp.]|nr:hypothetical protein [Tannerella sp.]